MGYEEEILPVREHRKKLSCMWSRIKSTTIGANDAAPGNRDNCCSPLGGLTDSRAVLAS